MSNLVLNVPLVPMCVKCGVPEEGHQCPGERDFWAEFPTGGQSLRRAVAREKGWEE